MIIFAPHSLYVKDGKFEKEMMELEIKDFQEIPLPSIGKLRIGEKFYSFNGDYNYIRFWVFINLLRIYFQNEYGIFYCDISQGLNIYMDAFKEAFESLLLFDKLRSIPQESIKVFILYSDPILNGVENPRIYDDVELKVKAFFDSPISKPDKEFAKGHLLDEETEGVLKNFYRTFRALRYNAPPVVLTFGYDSHKKIVEVTKKLLEKYLDKYNPQQFREQKTIYEYPLPEKPEEKTAIFLALALYENIARVLETKNIPLDKKIEFTTEDISKFLEVYLHYGLTINRDMLDKDIRRCESLQAGEDWKYLGYFVNTNYREAGLGDLLNDLTTLKRNFFAHSGMESNLVLVKRAGDDKVFKYREDAHDHIESLLYDELKSETNIA